MDSEPITIHRRTPRSANLRALRALILVRLREFYREPEAVFWTYVFPILLAGGLGVAFRSQPPEPVRVGWAEWTVGADSLRAALASDSGIILVSFHDSAEAAMALRNGRVAVVTMAAGDTISYRYDDTRAETAPALLKLNDVLQRAAGRTDPVATRREFVRERGSRYIDFLLPGLIGLNLMGSGVWGTGFSIVDARRKKLLKRLLATPMSKAEYLLSFPLAQLLLLIVEVGTILAFGVLAFDVPVRGSLAALALTCAIGSLTFGALGLLAAARPTTVEGASGLMNLLLMPMWVLSGVFFSATRFPDALQPVIRALPLTALVDALRLIMLEGGSLPAVSGQLAVLAVWLVGGFVVALRIFRWS
jgi:ABC-2 type transport system permease protein